MEFKNLLKDNYLLLNDSNEITRFHKNIKIKDFSKDISHIIQKIEYLEKSIFKNKFKNIGIFLYSNLVVFISLGWFLLVFALSYVMIFLVFLATYKLLYFISYLLFFNLIFFVFLVVGCTFLFKVFVEKIKIYLDLKMTEFWNFLLDELYILKNELLNENKYIWFYFILFLIKILLVFSDFILKFLNHILILIFLIVILGLFIIW